MSLLNLYSLHLFFLLKVLYEWKRQMRLKIHF